MWHISERLDRAGRWLIPAAVAGAALLFCARIAERSWRGAVFEFHPPRPASVVWPAGTADVAGREEVRFDSGEGDAIRGWLLPSRNGAAVALVHGTVADRSQFVAEIRTLSARGFGVLAFDEPGCGESGGRVTWGHSERAALRAAIDLLASRGARHIGVLGFSQGTYIAVQESAEDPRVEALVLEGAVANFREQTWHEFPRWGFLSEWPAWAGRRFAGYRAGDPQPEDLIGRWRRPLFLIGGDADTQVLASHAQRLYARAAGPKQIWIVHGAHHGDYTAAAPVEYPQRLAAFFDRTLVTANLRSLP